MIWRAGGRADLETLNQSFHTLMDRADELSPDIAMEHERVTRSEVVRLGLDRQLNLDMQGDLRAMALEQAFSKREEPYFFSIRTMPRAAL